MCLCAALEQAGSAPTARGEMCLTYAQRTRSGRLEQQDTINDHRIRLLQYGFPHPHLLHHGAVIFHRLACLCVSVACLCVCLSKEGALFSSVFCCLSLRLSFSLLHSHSVSLSPALCLSVLLWVIYMQQCILGSYRRVCSHGFCGVVWLVRHMEAGSWVHVIIYI